MLIGIIVGVVAVVAVIGFMLVRRKRSSGGPVSVAILCRSTEGVSVDAVAQHYTRVFNKPPQREPMPLPDGAGMATLLMAPPEGPPLGVFVVSHPLVENAAEVAKSIADPVARKAFEQHKAYCSVDFMGSDRMKEDLRQVAENICGSCAAVLAAGLGGKAMLFVAQHRDQFLYVDAPTVKRMMEGGTTEALANFRGPGAP